MIMELIKRPGAMNGLKEPFKKNTVLMVASDKSQEDDLFQFKG
jgi:hypothetical protein